MQILELIIDSIAFRPPAADRLRMHKVVNAGLRHVPRGFALRKSQYDCTYFNLRPEVAWQIIGCSHGNCMLGGGTAICSDGISCLGLRHQCTLCNIICHCTTTHFHFLSPIVLDLCVTFLHGSRHLTKPAWELVNGPNLYRTHFQLYVCTTTHFHGKVPNQLHCDSRCRFVAIPLLQYRFVTVATLPALLGEQRQLRCTCL